MIDLLCNYHRILWNPPAPLPVALGIRHVVFSRLPALKCPCLVVRAHLQDIVGAGIGHCGIALAGHLSLDDLDVDTQRANARSPYAILGRGHEDGNASGRHGVCEEIREGVRIDPIGLRPYNEVVTTSDGVVDPGYVVGMEVGRPGLRVEGARDEADTGLLGLASASIMPYRLPNYMKRGGGCGAGCQS